MTPHADFACLSKKCATDEGATTYDLPVGATRCPMCGSKRIRRIWTPPHISTGIAKRTDVLVEPAYEAAVATRNDARAATSARRAAPALAVPMHKVGAAIAGYVGSAQMGAMVDSQVASLINKKAEGRPVDHPLIIGAQQSPPTVVPIRSRDHAAEVAAVQAEIQKAKGQ